MFWFGYNILFAIGYTLMLPHFLMRMWRRGGYRKGFLQRLAVYSPEIREKLADGSRIWIHAVSVGEVFVALKFMQEMRRRDGDVSFVMTTTTSTGHAIARGRLAADDVLLYFPADFPWVISRVLSALKPRALMLTESELWPNLMRLAHRRGVPVILLNGRISASSFRGYQRLQSVFSRVLANVDLLLVQTATDKQRLEALGAQPERVHVLGTAKYDVSAAADGEGGSRRLQDALGVTDDTPILVGGSTWPGEEEVLLRIFEALKPDRPDLKLILVPRHAERASEVERVLLAGEVSYARRSQMQSSGSPDVVLVDTTGELVDFYNCATVVFVGKSLLHRGGQNFIEAASLGKPVVVGPHLENFPVAAAEFAEAGAFAQVANEAELQQVIRDWLDNPVRRSEYAQRARELVQSKRGASARSVDAIEALLRG